MSQELSEFEKEQLKLQKLGLGLGTGGGIFVGLLDTIVNAVQGKKQREANLQGIRETNATNERLVDKQNAAAAAEAEKQRAYESAPAQVSRLRSAGMSKAGALGAINGAGGYTPAPVNAAQAQAPTQEYQQIDFSGITNALQGMAQLAENKRQFNATLAFEREKFNEEKINNASIRDLNAAQKDKVYADIGLSKIQGEKLLADTELTLEQVRTECAKYDLTVKQVAEVAERTKMTIQQTLYYKGLTRLSSAQFDLAMSQKDLTDKQKDIAGEEFKKLQQEVSEFLSADATNQRKHALAIADEMLLITRNTAKSEEEIKEAESTIKAMQARVHGGDYGEAMECVKTFMDAIVGNLPAIIPK